MSIEFIKKQIDYEKWANTILSDTLRQIELPEERVLELFWHVIAVSSIWLDRVNGRMPSIKMWDEKTLDQCAALIEENHQKWEIYLADISESTLSQVVQFNMPNGGPLRKIIFLDAIQHMVNHGSYHRGQIISRIKGKVETLPLTTYIGFASFD